MKTGRYSLKELLTHNEIEQIIIPEIQRDYVWEAGNVSRLLDSIHSSYEKKISQSFKIIVNEQAENDQSIVLFLKQEFERLRFQQKIGFIYAYHDQEYSGKYFLIDGQQRLTTLFLLLLHLYSSIGKSADFKNLYFRNHVLKLDYKVRESSHDFLKLLVESELNRKDFNASKEFYAPEYHHDVTIQHLISNYAQIISRYKNLTIFQKEDLLDYIEHFIELNYFDTNLSEQGEQLYIYMNSRGEQLSHQEIIRAELMKHVDGTDEKKKVGKKWEEWQNFFWKNRDLSSKNDNADKGFAEFLRWATIIHVALNDDMVSEDFIPGNEQLSIKEKKGNLVKKPDTLESKRKQSATYFDYQAKYITYAYLNETFKALKILFSIEGKYIPVSKNWLHATITVTDYMILLPLIQYIRQNLEPGTNEESLTPEIERLAMFLLNITFFEGIAKSSETAVLDAIKMVTALCGEQKDIIYLRGTEGVKTILPGSEIYKLNEYANTGSNRSQLEEFVWGITLNKKLSAFLMGNISIIFKCAKYVSAQENTITELLLYQEIMEKVFLENRTDDKLRRLMLCYFDFKVEMGRGNGMPKYSFLGNETQWETRREWESVFERPESVEMIRDIGSRNKNILNDLFEQRENEYEGKGWEEAFIRDPTVFAYCKHKKIICGNQGNIILLERTNYALENMHELYCHVLVSRFKNEGMWIYESNTCILNLGFNSETSTLLFGNEKPDYGLHVIYNPRSDAWIMELCHKRENICNFFILDELIDWKTGNERLRLNNEVIYENDSCKSLLENIDEVAKIVRIKIKENVFPLLELYNTKNLLALI